MTRGYNIDDCPIWPLEVINLLLEIKMESEKEVIENHNSFGKTEEEMKDFFKSYCDYKETLKKEILPIYNEYLKLEIAFRLNKNDEQDHLELVRFIKQMEIEKYSELLSNEDKSKIVENAILEILRESFVDLEDDAEIESLSHLIELLDNVEKSAEEKLQLISLYENRYEFMMELQEFMDRTIPILKAHYPIISNDFNNALKTLKEMEDLNSILWEFFSSKPIDVEKTNISVSIFAFNQLSANFNGEILSHSVGIYFFPLKELKEKYSSHEEALVSDLKALGDSTRLNIMYSLAKEPMYTQQLAEKLYLTPATISHHIDILIKRELISITMDVEKSKRIYYEINGEKLRSLALDIVSIGEGKERSSDYGNKNQISIS